MDKENNNETKQNTLQNSSMQNKILKYLVEGIAVAIVGKWVASHKLTNNEILIIALTATVTFIMLDLYSPSISSGYKYGLGFALGSQLGFTKPAIGILSV